MANDALIEEARRRGLIGGGQAPRPSVDSALLAEAQRRGLVAGGTGKVFSGGILPFSKDASGTVSFDSDAGIVGAAKRILTLPGDVVTGKVDPLSDEGRSRSLEMAAAISPLSAAARAAPALVPGARVRPTAPKVPTSAELKAASKAGYEKAADLGVEYTGVGVKRFADETVQYLDETGFIEKLSPKTRALISELQSPPDGATASLKSIDAFRRRINTVAGSPDPTEAAAANIVLERLDRFLEAAVPANVVARSGRNVPAVPGQTATADTALAEQAVRILTEARGNAAANFRSGRITGVGNAAELRAAAANSGQNLGNTIRQRLASLILSRRDSRGFSKEEIAALRQIVEGTATTNTLRRLSNMLGGGGGLGQTLIASGGAALGGSVGGVPGAIIGAGLPAGIGTATRGVGNQLTKRQMLLADELVRKRSPLYSSRLAETPSTVTLPESRAALARALVFQQKPQAKPLKTEEDIAEFLRRGGA